MGRSWARGRRQRPVGGRAALSVLALTGFLGLAPALGQYRLAEDGRLFDANPQLGGSRYNTPVRPLSPLLGGNLIAEGNIGRAFGLRSYSPIGSPTAFQAATGSGMLSNFIRDSVSVADAGLPFGGLTARPFFDAARTAPTVGFFQGYYGAGIASPAAGAFPGQRGREVYDYLGQGPLRLGSYPPLQPEIGAGATSLREVFRSSRNTQLSSSIFGLSAPPLPGLLPPAELQPTAPVAAGVTARPPAPTPGGSAAGSLLEPLDLRQQVQPLVTPTVTALDVFLRPDAGSLLSPAPPAPTTPAEPSAGRDVPAGAAALPVTLRDPSLLPGYDVFTDMRLALDLSANPDADWYVDLLNALRSGRLQTPTLSPAEALEAQTRAAAAAENLLTRMLENPLQTFVGAGPTEVNEALRAAENAMRLGRYYDAVRHYDRVRRLDPVNPLPLLGQAHALLAAGEYVSAAVHLITALERFPDLVRFRLDLKALLGGGEVVDIRRADLMHQLARHEEAPLRFLLGYLEYHTGMTELGMRNLEAAARLARPGELISRYPDMLRNAVAPPTLPAAPSGDDAGRKDPAGSAGSAQEGPG